MRGKGEVMKLVTKCEKELIGDGYNYDDAKYMCENKEKPKEPEKGEKEFEMIPVDEC